MVPIVRVLSALPRAAMDLLAPHRCAACDAEPGHGVAFCATCEARVERAAASSIAGVPVLAGAAYGDEVAAALHRFKYGGRADLAPGLAALVVSAIDDALLPCDGLLVPVPLHPTRLAERGYNQSALLTRELARRFHIDWAPTALRRRRATLQQARQGREERRRNVAGAFAARRPGRLAGRRVVLVDDVVTTGATVADCIRALTESAAEVAAVLAVALAGDGRSAIHGG